MPAYVAVFINTFNHYAVGTGIGGIVKIKRGIAFIVGY